MYNNKSKVFFFVIMIASVLLTSCGGQKSESQKAESQKVESQKVESQQIETQQKESENVYTELSVKEFCDEYNIMDFHDDCGALAVDDGTERNAMLISWCAIGYMWDNPTFTCYIFKDRFTQHILDSAQYYSVSIFHNDDYDESLLYLGTTSGRDEDKFEGSGLRVTEIDGIPCFADADYIILCKKAASVDFDRDTMEDFVTYNSYYDEHDGVHRIFEGHIEKVLKRNGK